MLYAKTYASLAPPRVIKVGEHLVFLCQPVLSTPFPQYRPCLLMFRFMTHQQIYDGGCLIRCRKTPSLIPLPLHCVVHGFVWVAPPSFWPLEAKNVFRLVKDKLPLRRLWHRFAHANHFDRWLDALCEDILFFDREHGLLIVASVTCREHRLLRPRLFLVVSRIFWLRIYPSTSVLGQTLIITPPGWPFSCLPLRALHLVRLP